MDKIEYNIIDNFELNVVIYLILKIIVIIGALNWGLFAINKDYNIVEVIGSFFSDNFRDFIVKMIYVIITLSTVYIMLQRKTFLPFLDVTIVPVSKFLNESKQKDFEFEIIINAKGAEKVIYWAATKKTESDKYIKDYKKAYGGYENSGISLVNKDGKARLFIKCPQEYYVKYNKILPKHIHYRIVTLGILGPVQTINLSC
jgi:uncharacterized membrane protein YuzA (DUF378 family)